MPFTATVDDQTVDATTDAGVATIDQLRAIPAAKRPALTCRACDGRMHPKRSKAGTRFFAHAVADSDCPTAGETADHRMLKELIARLIRDSHGVAMVEAGPSAGDRGVWRADVLAEHDGRRVAFEIQLASMTTEEGQRRTDRYAQDGIGTVWVTYRHAAWLYTIPGVKLSREDEAWVVARGAVRLIDDGSRAEEAPLFTAAKFVSAVLAGGISPLTLDYFGEHVPDLGSNGRLFWHRDAVAWTRRADIEAYHRHLKRQEREAAREARAAADRRRHQERTKALLDRQHRLIIPVVNQERIDVDTAAVGVVLQNGSRKTRSFRPMTWVMQTRGIVEAGRGATQHAAGLAIFTTTPRRWQRPAIIICPVADRITPAIATQWQQAGVKIIVADQREHDRIAPRCPGVTVQIFPT